MIDLRQQTNALLQALTTNVPNCGDCPYFFKSSTEYGGDPSAHCIYGLCPSLDCPGASIQSSRYLNPQK